MSAEAGKSSNHFIGAEWNDWKCFLQPCDGRRFIYLILIYFFIVNAVD